MVHLTPEEVLMFTDQALDPTEAERVRNHLASCPRCSAEVRLHRSILQAARQAPLHSVSPVFARKVLGLVGRRTQGSALLKLLAIVGKLLPMAAVLVVLAAVLSIDLGGSSRAEQERSAVNTAVSDFSARTFGAIETVSSALSREAMALAEKKATKYLLMTLGVLVLYVAVDQLMWKRILRLKS